ncbi:carbonic anhydrase [Catalinimonas alkaloidigena]|uniref:Carbonic anhydrase 2 n=1 Tax=Catalinimonas alkaloidigena TaxID=1075417 RepID=A0A1G9K821_9BACT|nr:carbonate dehydratase [Catalinimonas alkaloidigena]SDL45907.1 carbonic anhydrase [Catalinimonas alkaloidigena]
MKPTARSSSSWRENLKYDFKSGLVVFLVAIPLCLGIALASGAPLFSGIIAGIVGGIVIGSLSGSQLSVSGPAAGLTVIVFSAIEKLGTFESFLLATMLAGLMQVGLGYLKAGVIGHFFPNSVIKGLLAAIGITLILKQIPHALGYDADAEGDFVFSQMDGENTFTEIINAFLNPSLGALLIAALAMAILVLWERPLIKKSALGSLLPGSLVAVIAGVLINLLYEMVSPGWVLSGNHLVSLPKANNAQEVLSLFTMPDFSQIGNVQVYISALTIAIVASLETLLNLEATDRLDPLKRNSPPNRELKAQGVGNFVSGLIGGLPVTSVIVRSSANVNSGARSRMSAVIHGILLLVCVITIPGWLNRIPLAALAAILLFIGYKLAKISIFRQMYQTGLSQFIPFVVTILAILFTDLLIGICIGLAVGLFFVLRANYRTTYFFHKEKQSSGEKIKINLSEHVSFLNKASLVHILDDLPENSFVEIDASHTMYMDHDILETIEDFKETARSKNIQLQFVGKEKLISQELDEPLPLPTPTSGADFEAYRKLFENNRQWVTEKLSLDPQYFEKLALGQQPKFLWIGCSDSRVPATEITGTSPGDMFVHRNVANLVVHTDLNLMSVLQYAVEVLKVKHIIVCGHYGCGGVQAAMEDKDLGMINKWLMNIKDVHRLHRTELTHLNQNDRFKRLVELNVIEQVYNLHKTSFVQRAWAENADLHIHGWVYDLRDGRIKDLEIDIHQLFEEYDEVYRFGNGATAPRTLSSTPNPLLQGSNS